VYCGLESSRRFTVPGSVGSVSEYMNKALDNGLGIATYACTVSDYSS